MITTLLACSPSMKGELMIVADTDLKPPGDFDTLRLEVRQGGVVLHALDYSLTTYTLPGSLGVVQGTRNDPVDVRAIAKKNGVPLLVVDVRTTVPPDRVVALPINLDAACLGMIVVKPDGSIQSTCPSGQTCNGGACVDVNVDPSTLPPYSPGRSYQDAGAPDTGDPDAGATETEGGTSS